MATTQSFVLRDGIVMQGGAPGTPVSVSEGIPQEDTTQFYTSDFGGTWGMSLDSGPGTIVSASLVGALSLDIIGSITYRDDDRVTVALEVSVTAIGGTASGTALRFGLEGFNFVSLGDSTFSAPLGYTTHATFSLTEGQKITVRYEAEGPKPA